MGSESHLRRGSPQKASWKPLGALLEALGAEKTTLESLLGRSWGALDPCYSDPDPPGKPEQVVGPESTVGSICLRHVVW